jgi:hypothetical protein
MKSFKAYMDERCWPGYKETPGKKAYSQGSCVKEDVLEEGRPSQRHPLEGHEYHKKSDAELVNIAKDAHKAAEAMKSHNTTAENKYRDQANDSATVRYWRKKNGMPNWYKKKYGHMKEEVEELDEVAAWQRKEGKSESGGLNRKGIESYRRENPGSKLSMAVTTKPSKLKPGSKAAKRRKSFCSRMGGMKKKLTSAKTANDPDSRINKALRKWNC